MTTLNPRGTQPIGRQLRRMFVRMLLRHADAPESLYLGLVTEIMAPDTDMALIAAREPLTLGYRRQRLDPAAWNVSDVANGAEAVAKGSFTNTSETNWPSVAASFLTTSPSGGDGALVAISELRTGPVEMRPGWVLEVPILLDYGE